MQTLEISDQTAQQLHDLAVQDMGKMSLNFHCYAWAEVID